VNNSTLILIGALLLLGAKGGGSIISPRKKGTITWDGWCDDSIGGWCYDWDYKVIVRVDDYKVISTNVLGRNYDAQNSNSWQMVMDKTLAYADKNRPEGIPPFDQIDWDVKYTKGWEKSQTGFDFTNVKREIAGIIGTWLCLNYPNTCDYTEVIV
jgi:hypothetical protein